jgi:hypothetical protein
LNFDINDYGPNQGFEIPLNPDYNNDYRDGFDYFLDFETNYPTNCTTGGLPMDTYFIIQLFEVGNPIPIKEMLCNNESYELEQFDQSKNYFLKVIKIKSGTLPWPHQSNISINLTLRWVQNDIQSVKNKNTGNLRIKSITLKDADGSSQIRRSFQYNYFDNIAYSGGVLRARPINSIFVTNEHGIPDDTSISCLRFKSPCSYITLSSSPAYNLNHSFGKSVYYENVTEIYENLQNDSKNYKKEFVFEEYPLIYPDLLSTHSPIPYWPHLEYASGKVKEERWYDNQNQIVKEISNNYEYDDYYNHSSSDFQGANILSYGVGVALNDIILTLDSGPSSTSPTLCAYDFYMNSYFYPIVSSWVKHLNTTEKTYENGELKMTNSTHYEYDNTYSHLNPVRVKSSNSLGQEIKTEYTYDHPYKKNEPTTIVQYENGSPISVQKTTFNSANLPQYVFAKRGATTLDDSPPSDDLKITYDRYDAYGNLQQYTLADGTPVSIVWGYNGQYPIAKVEGLAYSAIQAQANALSTNNNLNESSFNALRTLVNSNNAMLSCYLYEPLVGVKMIIQPNGQKEIYHYDEAGRLKVIKDHEGNVLKELEYKYFNQP